MYLCVFVFKTEICDFFSFGMGVFLLPESLFISYFLCFFCVCLNNLQIHRKIMFGINLEELIRFAAASLRLQFAQ